MSPAPDQAATNESNIGNSINGSEIANRVEQHNLQPTFIPRLNILSLSAPIAEDLLLAAQADTEAWYGKLKNAHELTRRAMDSAQRNDAKESAAEYQAAAALREVETGNREQARAEANAALK